MSEMDQKKTAKIAKDTTKGFPSEWRFSSAFMRSMSSLWLACFGLEMDCTNAPE
jgi:hypothetical protein